MYSLTLTTAPATEPVTLAQAKAHIRLDADGYDDDISTFYIPAARQQVEAFTDRQLITATYTMTLRRFCGRRIYLPKGQLQSVTSLKYYDDDDAQQTYSSSNYYVNARNEPGFIELKNDNNWPSIENRADAIEIIYVCGYGAATDVPEILRTATLMQLGYMYEHRGDTEQAGIYSWLRNLVQPYRLGDEFLNYG